MKLNTRLEVTLRLIFEDPVHPNILWTDIENLFRAHGAKIIEGGGSRVRIELRDVSTVFHRPHPSKETERGTVRKVRSFLNSIGIVP